MTMPRKPWWENLPTDMRPMPRELTDMWSRLANEAVNHARMNGGSEDDGHDLAQDALLKAWRSWDQNGPPKDVEAWLRKIVKRTWLTTVNKRKGDDKRMREGRDSDGKGGGLPGYERAPHPEMLYLRPSSNPTREARSKASPVRVTHSDDVAGMLHARDRLASLAANPKHADRACYLLRKADQHVRPGA
jgi:DNA-directed RNA polymerase specialized sigma24 family protein